MQFHGYFIGTAVLGLIVTIGSGVVLQAQEVRLREKDLPSAVVRSFHKTYPSAKITGAAREVENRKTYYEVESIDGTVTRNLLYTTDGRLTEVEESISFDRLPSNVSSSFLKEFPNARVNKVERLTRGKSVSYEFTVNLRGSRQEIVLDTNGTIITGAPDRQKDAGENGEEDDNDD